MLTLTFTADKVTSRYLSKQLSYLISMELANYYTNSTLYNMLMIAWWKCFVRKILKYGLTCKLTSIYWLFSEEQSLFLILKWRILQLFRSAWTHMASRLLKRQKSICFWLIWIALSGWDCCRWRCLILQVVDLIGIHLVNRWILSTTKEYKRKCYSQFFSFYEFIRNVSSLVSICG